MMEKRFMNEILSYLWSSMVGRFINNIYLYINIYHPYIIDERRTRLHVPQLLLGTV